MKLPLWITAATACASFLLGIWLAPALGPQEQGKSTPQLTDSPPNRPRISQEIEKDRPPSSNFRRHERPSAESEPITISHKSIKNLMAGKSFRGWDYRNLGDHAMDALTILGATDEELTAAGNFFETSANLLKMREKELAKVSQPDPSSILIDLTAVRSPAAEIVRDLQQNLRSSLPPATADLLISSIKWEDYYIPGGETSITLTVKQSSDGRTWGDATTNTGYHGTSVNTILEPSDSSGITAGTIFREWASLTGDLRLIPQPQKK